MKKCLNRDIIKYFAIFAMLLDHIAWTFLQFSSPTARIFHILGRTTAPIMCFFIAEGYHYTRSKKKYALRLFIFALISQLPWWLMHGGAITLSFNMIFTLFFGLLAVHVEATRTDKAEKVILIAILCALTLVCDWYVYAVLWCVIFYKYRDNEQKRLIFFSLVGIGYFLVTVYQYYSATADIGNSLLSSLYTLGVFLSMPILMMYNGEKGHFKSSKWVFYVFYPLHMFVIAVVHLIRNA
ncbi:MAG: conjugal transfer protein TraX [Faecalibacterium sp.]|nr:conjugal transfer protein TraX [Ruminococcus sp.]MCM1393014.1 conjugal transfer protein TraX [Ruminococcus sp.]MCM1486084.1 conjugal transfer protein TraX [Faecalibacterium sp.]